MRKVSGAPTPRLAIYLLPKQRFLGRRIYSRPQIKPVSLPGAAAGEEEKKYNLQEIFTVHVYIHTWWLRKRTTRESGRERERELHARNLLYTILVSRGLSRALLYNPLSLVSFFSLAINRSTTEPINLGEGGQKNVIFESKTTTFAKSNSDTWIDIYTRARARSEATSIRSL